MASPIELNGGAPRSPAQMLYDAIGRPIPPRNDDPAFQPPRDPLEGVNMLAQAGLVHREIPNITVATGWDVNLTRQAYDDLVIGLFDRPAQLIDSIVGDSRVQSCLGSRVGGLLGRKIDFVVPRKYRDSKEAKRCRNAFREAWPKTAGPANLSSLDRWAVMIGFGPAQLLWNMSGEYAVPEIHPWHPRYTYYHWTYRVYVAITMDTLAPIIPGDGHWVLHAPHGEYRGWMNGAMRAVAPWWLARNYALRDWARYSERHGLPMVKAKAPAVGDPIQQASWRQQLSQLGQETVIHIPQNVDQRMSYDVDLLEARDTAHEGFRMLIQACDMEITLALLAQNLTSEVKEGSFAAARVHADVRQALLEADARALETTIYQQVARPFAELNFGDAELAPRVIWNVKPYEDDKTQTEILLMFAQAIYAMRNAGFELKDVEKIAKDFGMDLGKIERVTPLQSATGRAQDAAAKAEAKEQVAATRGEGSDKT